MKLWGLSVGVERSPLLQLSFKIPGWGSVCLKILLTVFLTVIKITDLQIQRLQSLSYHSLGATWWPHEGLSGSLAAKCCCLLFCGMVWSRAVHQGPVSKWYWFLSVHIRSYRKSLLLWHLWCNGWHCNTGDPMIQYDILYIRFGFCEDSVVWVVVRVPLADIKTVGLLTLTPVKIQRNDRCLCA